MNKAVLAAALLVAGCGESAGITDGKDLLERELKDPASAQYRGVFESSTKAVCGEVNARNAMGGYVGFHRFYVVDGKANLDPVDIPERDPESQSLNKLQRALFMYELYCKR